jgi:hypothetical protein
MLTKADIEKYFFAAKQESLLFLIIGALAIVAAISFYFFLKNNFYKGAAVPLLVIGLVQMIVGYSVYSRSDNQRIDMVYAYDMNPHKLKTEELPRMITVNKNFQLYRWIEIVFLIIGAALAIYFKSDATKTFFMGLGIGLTIQSTIMLGADYFAEKRGLVYQQQLENFAQGK